MVQAVLYVGHGSRSRAAIEEAVQFINKCRGEINVPIQEVCFLELEAPHVVEGIANCVDRGATKIAIVPVFLLAANHAKKDVPSKIEIGKALYPQVDMTYGEVLGVHPKIITSIYERVAEQRLNNTSNAYVLLVGRGSSDLAVKRDLTTIAQRLQKEYLFHSVDVCFLYGMKPSFEEALWKLRQVRDQQVYIVPYLLFTGILKNRIKQKIKQQNVNGQPFILCDSLGYNEQIKQVLVERTNALLYESS